jgi:hypothetical protein
MANQGSGSKLSRRSLRRREGIRAPKRRFLIVCEGAVTEREYIDAVRRELRYLPIDIEVCAGNPNTAREIVAHAVEKMKRAKDSASRSGDATAAYDEVWCAFDAGEHPYEKEARIQARDNGIKLATSAPCIELWILLHKADQNASLTRKQALRMCQKLALMENKHLVDPQAIYRGFSGAAQTRSQVLRNARERDQNPGANPATDFDLLVCSIERAKEQFRKIAGRQ